MFRRRRFIALLCILALLFVYPSASLGNEMEAEEYGVFLISLLVDGKWQEVGSLGFNKFYNEKTIDLDDYIDESEVDKIRLVKKGGGAAHLDAVLLGDNSPILANDIDEIAIKKLSKADYDVINIDENGLTLTFENVQNTLLTIVGRIEKEVISKEPFQFPIKNSYKAIDENSSFYTYELKDDIKIDKDSIFDNLTKGEPFVKEFCLPGSGHPPGFFYAYIGNDSENLYVAFDFTSDNTMDGEKDYAKVNIKTDDGIKVFEVNENYTKWGKTLFTYTDKVEYEHKIYEFTIPLSEIGLIKDGNIEISFTAYGTATDPWFVRFEYGAYEVYEKSAEIEIRIERVYPDEYPLMVYYGTRYETADPGIDYGTIGNNEEVFGSVEFPPNERFQPILIPIIDDNEKEDVDRFYIFLWLNGEEPNDDGSYTFVDIIDDDGENNGDEPIDPEPFYDFLTSTYTVNEGERASIGVRFNSNKGDVRPMSINNDATFEVNYYTEGGSATPGVDYTDVEGGLEFNIDEEEEQILYFQVETRDDSEIEENETIILKLYHGDETEKEAILTIIDNDEEVEDPGEEEDSGNNKPDPIPDPDPEPDPEPIYYEEEEEEELAPDGGVIIRRTYYEPISEAKKISSRKKEIVLRYDKSLIESGKYNYPRICYWNKDANKWVALNTYMTKDGRVKAINDGGYKGWFKVFGNVQPRFLDIAGSNIEDICNRLNGLGLLEGFFVNDNFEYRNALLEKLIPRSEFVTLLYRFINIDDDFILLADIDLEEAEVILQGKFEDCDTIPIWSKNIIASMVDEGLLEDIEGKFSPERAITTIDAAKMINKSLKLLPDYEKLDFTKLNEDTTFPEWAKAAVDDKSLEAYIEETYLQDLTISREEALLVLYRIFILELGW